MTDIKQFPLPTDNLANNISFDFLLVYTLFTLELR